MSRSHHADLWQPPHQEISMAGTEVHVWRGRLNQSQQCVDSFFDTLAPDEKERAARFHFQRDCNHFITARGLLRAILALYLKIEPRGVRFYYSPHGKPHLAPEVFSDLRFNLSHSHGLALLAVTRGRELGIDVEWIRPEVVHEQLAERFFSPREVAMLRSLPTEQQPEAFFNCWTRKEAYIKARGEGLSLPLDTFDVTLAPGEPAMLLETRIDPEEMARWHIVELAPGANFKAALVVEGQDWRLRCWQWLR